MKLEIVNSPILLESQVEIIFSRLNEAPKLYETDEKEVKEVIVKLFNIFLTLLVVEYDPLERKAFGYMRNERFKDLSEWGCFSIDELIKLGFEMDIYFGNKLIALDGSLSDKEVKHG